MEKIINPDDFKRKFEECDDKFNTIFKLTSVASKVIDSDLKIIKVNQALTEMLGFSTEELEGTEILEYACPEYIAHWHRLQDELWNRNTPFFKLDACLIKKDKSLVWVNVTTILFKDEGKTYGFTVLDNITGLKHLEESEKRLGLALKYSKMAAWEMDLKSLRVIRSETHDQIFGYEKPLKQWNLDTYLKHFLPDDAALFQKALRILQTQNSFNFKGRVHNGDLIFKWIHFQGETELDAEGRQSKLIGTLKDITKEKLQERQKEDFISIASHELKTPITSLKASLQLINKLIHKPGDNLVEVMSRANKSMNKVSLLIEVLLSATSMHEGQLQLNKLSFSISKIIDDCCDHVRSGGIHSIKIYGDEKIRVQADPDRIEQVVENLINNAVKYAPESKEIRINIEKLNGMAKISVSDTGPGIPTDKLPHLFDRFYRVESSGSRYSGLGLALYISAEIVKKGKIGATSEEGKGSTFWFTLPLS